MANYYQQDIKLKDMEKNTLESKIKTLQSELQTSNFNLMHLINKVTESNGTIQHMKQQLKVHIDANDK